MMNSVGSAHAEALQKAATQSVKARVAKKAFRRLNQLQVARGIVAMGGGGILLSSKPG